MFDEIDTLILPPEEIATIAVSVPCDQPVADDLVPVFVQEAEEISEQIFASENNESDPLVDDYQENGDEIAGLKIVPFKRKSGKRRRDGMRFRKPREGGHWRRRRAPNVWRAVKSGGRKRQPA